MRHFTAYVGLLFSSLFLSAPTFSQNDMPADHNMAQHAHSKRELPKDRLTPALDIRLYPDAKAGFNLHLVTNHYEMEPPEFSKKTKAGHTQGHGHLFINGEKRERLYGHYFYLAPSELKEGINQITVTLNDHDHNLWAKDGKQILATIFLDTRKKEPIQHYMSTYPTSAQ